MNPVEASLAEQLIADAWQKGDLFYKLKDHQLDVYDFLRSRQGLTCTLLLSRRYGKTHISFIADVEDALKNPKARIAYFYPTLKQGKQIINPIAEIVFSDCPMPVASWRDQESCYEFTNGAKIFIFGCDTIRDIDRHRGPKYTAIRIDEAGVHPYLRYLYKSVLLPTLLTATEKPLVAFSGTPAVSIEHEFKEIFESCFAKGDAIVRTISQNTSIDEETRHQFIMESGGYEATETRREYFCEWVTDSEFAVIPEWRDHYIEELPRTEYYQFYDIICSMDIGGRDKTVIEWSYYDFKRAKLIFEHEAVLTGQETTPAVIANAIKQIEEQYYHGKRIRRWADNNAVILLQDLSINHNIHFNPTSKDLKLAMVADTRTMINEGRVAVHPRMIETIGCLRSAVWDNHKKEFARSGVYGHFDALDAVIYTIRNLDESTNPIPPLHGIDTRNIHGAERIVEMNRDAKRNLIRAFRRQT